MAWHFEIKMSFQNKGKILAFLKRIKMPNIRNGIDDIRKIVWSAREL